MRVMKLFAGTFTPIATPFRMDDSLDEPALRRNVRRWLHTPLTGLVVLGSTGEAAQLDDAEADQVLSAVREELPRDRPLIAGTGRESTKATIDATRRAAAAGVDAVLVRTPAFFKPQMTSEAFVAHFSRVADASPVPVLLYNVTMFTGVNLLPDAVEALSSHPNIVGMKESGGDAGVLGELVARTPPAFTVLAGSGTTLFHALCAGCDGGVLAIASLMPDACVEMRSLIAANRLADARELQRRVTPLAKLIGATFGVAGLKAAMNLIGYEGGYPRPPLRPVDAAAIDTLRAHLERAGIQTAVSQA